MTNSNPEKASKLKTAFQWAGAVLGMLPGENPQAAYQHFGFTWDYTKAKLATMSGPKN